MRARFLFFLILCVSIGVTISAAEPLPQQLNGVGITEKLGQKLPLDFELVDSKGVVVKVRDLFHGRPLLLSFGYYTCPMLCNLVATGISDGLNGIPLIAGKDFDVVTISVDPRDTIHTAEAFRAKHVLTLHHSKSAEGWRFLIGTPDVVKALADAVGFGYRYDSKSGEYAHASGILFLTPEGVVSRYLYGISYKPLDFKLSIFEAKDRHTVSTVERVVLFCYNYDSSSNSYVLAAKRVMKIGAFFSAFLLGSVLLFLHFRKADK